MECHLTLIEKIIADGIGVDILDKDREPDLITAFDDLTKQQRATAGEDAFADLQIDAALAKEIAELGQELTGHLPNQDLYLARQNRGFTFDDLVNIAVFQMKSILGITLAEDAVVERNHTLLKTFDHSQVRLAIPQFQDINGIAADIDDIGGGVFFKFTEPRNCGRQSLGRKGVVCSNRLNEQIREIANPPRNGVREIKCGGRLFREGDRIIQTKSEGDVSNGDVGVISAIREDGEEEPTIHIRLLDGREFEYSADMLEKVDLSYCISIHKSQGAEFPVVIIPILKEHYIMLRRNLLYTAISRAKVKVILIGQKQAVFMAIHKSDVDKRNTILSDRIVAYYAREKQNLVG